MLLLIGGKTERFPSNHHIYNKAYTPQNWWIVILNEYISWIIQWSSALDLPLLISSTSSSLQPMICIALGCKDLIHLWQWKCTCVQSSISQSICYWRLLHVINRCYLIKWKSRARVCVFMRERVFFGCLWQKLGGHMAILSHKTCSGSATILPHSMWYNIARLISFYGLLIHIPRIPFSEHSSGSRVYILYPD